MQGANHNPRQGICESGQVGLPDPLFAISLCFLRLLYFFLEGALVGCAKQPDLGPTVDAEAGIQALQISNVVVTAGAVLGFLEEVALRHDGIWVEGRNGRPLGSLKM